jgi:hypothetical protein
MAVKNVLLLRGTDVKNVLLLRGMVVKKYSAIERHDS